MRSLSAHGVTRHNVPLGDSTQAGADILAPSWKENRGRMPMLAEVMDAVIGNRLDILVVKMIKAMRDVGDESAADRFAAEHNRDRVTPENIRTIVDRPPDSSAVRLVEVPRRRRW